ncbi:MucR family transcriptional regulator [Agrobacterium salinitolerans]
MISIDIDALEDLEQVDAAIQKLCKLRSKIFRERWLKGPLAEPWDDVQALRAKNTRGNGFAPWVVEAIKSSESRTILKPGADIQGREELLRMVQSGEATRMQKCRLGLVSYTFNGMDPQAAIQDDGIVCLIDGEKRKFLSRYVRQIHGLEWQDYLRRFDLPADYPRTSKDVIEQRKELAIERGLGKTRAPEPDEEEQRVQVTIPVRRTFGRRSAPQQVSVQVDIGSSVNTTVERRKERRLLDGLL